MSAKYSRADLGKLQFTAGEHLPYLTFMWGGFLIVVFDNITA